jgi:tetratricopeptide (TPR) repeat protein
MQELANDIQIMLAEDEPFHDILVAILSAGDYYDTAAIQHFMDMQELAALLPEEEKLKLKADSFLLYKRLLKAISLYDDILRREEDIDDQKFIGDVYHNKGVALAKNMELTKAKLCFLEAYNRNQKAPSLEAFVMLRLIEEISNPETSVEQGQDVVWKEASAFGMEEADFSRMIMLVEDALEDSVSTTSYIRYQKAVYNKEHGDYEAFNQRVDMLLNQWKEEFREQVI